MRSSCRPMRGRRRLRARFDDKRRNDDDPQDDDPARDVKTPGLESIPPDQGDEPSRPRPYGRSMIEGGASVGTGGRPTSRSTRKRLVAGDIRVRRRADAPAAAQSRSLVRAFAASAASRRPSEVSRERRVQGEETP